MSSQIIIRPIGPLVKFADLAMNPVMRYLAGKGAWREEPQRTHFWNNRRLTDLEIKCLNHELFFNGKPDVTSTQKGLFRFNCRRWGGWKKFYVLAPDIDPFYHDFWYVGRKVKNWAVISRVPISLAHPSENEYYSMVRVLIGQKAVDFFGIDEKGNQIKVLAVCRGEVGNCQELGNITLR